MIDLPERDELAAVIDAAVPHDAVPSFRFTHAVKAADAALKAGYGKAPAASEGVTKQTAQVLCAEEVCSTWEADDGTICCNGQCKTIADRLASAGLLASHPVTDVVQTVERVLIEHLGFPKLPPAEWVDEAAHIAGIVEEIRGELGEVQR